MHAHDPGRVTRWLQDRVAALLGIDQPDEMDTAAPAITDSPVAVTRDFLEALQAEDLDRALSMLADDVEYTNVSLPSIHGRGGVERLFRPLLGRIGFRVHFHAAGIDELDSGVVLNERTDALIMGPVTLQFWVYGRFEVRDGLITVWRDSFDWHDITVGLIRGVVGVVLPFARRTWPS